MAAAPFKGDPLTTSPSMGSSNLQRQVVGDFDQTWDRMIPSQNSRNCRNSVADKLSSIFCCQLEVPHTGQLDPLIGGRSSNRVYNNSISVTAQGAGNTHELPISSRDC